LAFLEVIEELGKNSKWIIFPAKKAFDAKAAKKDEGRKGKLVASAFIASAHQPRANYSQPK
jgi:hypothetical protein